jgi:PIN domain nuclease of toxin-antitoxin system
VNAQALINDANNDIFLSVGSLWEIAIKLSLTQPFETFIPQQLGINSISLLSITVDHAVKVSALPFHHRDPFDRLLVAQALVSDMPIVGADGVFDAYGVKRLW